MFIVLEGLDGAGKSTQIKLIGAYINEKGMQVKNIHFPRFDAPIYGELIAKFLRGDFGDVDTVDPQVIGLVYAGDRNDAAPMIRQWLQDGYTVIVDRYVYSNIAYQCSKTKTAEEKNHLREWVLNLEYDHFNIPKPDINIFLDVPLSFIRQKLESVRKGDDRKYLKGQKDIHEMDFDLQRKVREMYLEQAMLDSTFKVVPCANRKGEMETPDIIFDKIKAIIDGFMGSKA
ncbi:MAG: dTMP kinase [Prevotellaceae bacterium]|jgi:dTMP kinase|nr:dTMP kinase [Prevotellaceae bacterium]